MPLPERVREIHNGRRAHAPYNFVPLPERVLYIEEELPDQDRYHPERHTGWFEVTLTTSSPLYVRAALTPAEHGRSQDPDEEDRPLREQQRNKPAFFYGKDETVPLIPGSSLRGMFRALVEIASYGKMQWLSDDPLVYRAVGGRSVLGEHYRAQMLGPNRSSTPRTFLFDYPSPRLKGGYLEIKNNDWFIRPAVEHEGESFVHVEYAQADAVTKGNRDPNKTYQVCVMPAVRAERGSSSSSSVWLNLAESPRVIPQQGDCPEGMVPGTLVVSNHMGGQSRKHMHCVIYEQDQQAVRKPISPALKRLYQRDSKIPHADDQPVRKIENTGDPLFYLEDAKGEIVFFGPTLMFRLPYRNSPEALVPEALRCPTKTDLAEAIFGFTRPLKDGVEDKDKDKLNAYAGRVFFGDATWQHQGDPWLSEAFVPKVLGGPKPTTFQHYLTQRDAGNSKGSDLAHYDSGPDRPTIRGHKLYWHRGEVTKTDIAEGPEVTESDKVHTQFRPVKAGASFTFRLSFENLSALELGALLWVLDLGADPRYRLKLGMGKPLGMGAVGLCYATTLIDRGQRYRKLFDGEGWCEGRKPEEEVATVVSGARQAFKERMDGHVNGNCNGAKFESAERIQALRRMLSWPGPARGDTEYMVLDPDAHTNDFKDRPVLPHPLDVPVPGQPQEPTGGGELAAAPDSTAEIERLVKEQVERSGRSGKALYVGKVIEGVSDKKRSGGRVQIEICFVDGEAHKSPQVGKIASITWADVARPKNELVAGQTVSFELDRSGSGNLKALNVRKHKDG